MLELIELRFRSIGRFVEEQIIDISTLSDFIQIDGANLNTKGSSGSGKSTVFNALDYLLGINNIPATVLQSRLTKEPIWVQGTFNWDGEKTIITRTKSKIEIEIDLDVKKGKDAEDKLIQMFGMPGDLFRKILHKRQKEGGFFLELTPGFMHDFLMDCTNLSPFKKHYITIDKKLSDLEDSISELENSLKVQQQGLTSTQDAILAMGLSPIRDMHREVIIELKNKSDKSTAAFAERKAQCEREDREYLNNRPAIGNAPNDSSAREAFEERRKEIEQGISACLEKERKRQDSVRLEVSEKVQQRNSVVARIDASARAEKEAAKLAFEIKSIRDQTCPRCEQPWATESAKRSEEDTINKLLSYRPIIADGVRAKDEKEALDIEIENLKALLAPVYDPELPDLNERLREVTQEILDDKRRNNELYEQQSAEMRRKLDEFSAGLTEIRKKNDLELEGFRGQMDLDRRVLDAAVQKLKAYEEASQRYESTLARLKKTEEEFTKEIDEDKSKLEKFYKERILATDSKGAIRAYVSRSFDDALDAISDKATQIIRCIPNMSNATIQLEGIKETQKGVLKEEVNAVISSDGETGVPIKSLSGGERSALDLAVDLAVIDYIETKTGKGMNIFILDEPFNGLGTVEIEMALDVLKNANTNKKLIIVDHNPEVKQMVASRLVVTRDGSTSKVG